MLTLVAEKRSVGMELARLTGCRTRQDGYMEGGFLLGQPCRVTWALGHLCQLVEEPETRGLHWKEENLPVLPKRFILVPRPGKDGKPDPGYVKQLNVIQQLFATTDTIVNCGDAGREGEVIQRWIYQYVGEKDPRCIKPVKRLWISSMTDEAIHKGLDDLRPAAEFDALFDAGLARTEADWLVGINATEALTVNVNKGKTGDRRVYTLGRVQTPILALVCRRYLENKAFVPTPFWTVRLDTESRGVPFSVTSVKRFGSYGEAESLTKRAGISLLQVSEARHEPKTVNPPLLHDQTTLQQEASRRYGMTPEEAMAATQKLYEMKLVTYPRTGSQFIPKDVLKTIPARLKALAENTSDPNVRMEATRLSQAGVAGLGRRSVNDVKVTDHHALLVEAAKTPELTGKELKIYTLIAERMVEAFGAPCECDVYRVKLTCAGEEFSASTTKVVKPGWKAVRGTDEYIDEPNVKKDEDDESKPQRLPELRDGDMLTVNKAETVRGQTKPKPLYTDDSLLQAIKTAGNDSEDDEVKAAMKNIGIGTAATRSGIIKTLFDVRKYLRKEGKKIVPTDTGLEVFNLVKDMDISNVEMTGRWEIALTDIADGKARREDFNARIRSFTTDITHQILGTKVGDGFEKAALAENITCPLCGSIVKVWDNFAKCTGKDCGLSANRIVCGRKLGESTMKHFFENGRTGLVKGFVSPKTGNKFDARLKLVVEEKNGHKYANAQFVFDDKKPTYKKPTKKG